MKAAKRKSEESLDAKLVRWRRAMADAATGPLIMAAEICDLADRWEEYRAEADGLDCTTWLRTVARFPQLRYWRSRQRAVEELGEAARRHVHHDVAVWLIGSIPASHREPAKFELIRLCKQNGGVPLAPAQAKAAINEMVGHKPQRRKCARCAKLEALLKRHGIEC